MRAWRPNGGARRSLVVATRVASSSPFNCRRSTQAPEPQTFPRARRLTRGVEIAKVRQEGKRVRTASMDVRVTASLCASGRVGLVIPRYKHSAVDRNRLKRRLRELVRLEVLPTMRALDVVLRVAPHAYDRSFELLQHEVRKLARQLADVALPVRTDTP